MNCTGRNCIMQYDKVNPATCPCVPYCPNATPPKTNADKIREMTDEELAELLDQTYFNGMVVGKNSRHSVDIKYWLKWLKEEVKDGSTDRLH